MNDRSELALQADGQKPIDAEIVEVWGACVHTTGRGVPTKAAAASRPAMDVAIEYYLSGKNAHGPHYVLGHDGELVQLASERHRLPHVGSIVRDPKTGARVDRRDQYLNGTWLTLVPPTALKLWKRAWPKYSSPQALFPKRRPSECYLGIELIPCGAGLGTPASPWELFTVAQYERLAKLLADIGKRHQLPSRWWEGPRLVGHEDVGLIDRCNRDGGWDPGGLREKPYFDWPRVRARVGELYRERLQV